MAKPVQPHTDRRIAILSKSDESGGGASRVACQIRELIGRYGQGYMADQWVGMRRPPAPCHSLSGGVLGRIIYKASRSFSRIIGLPDFLSTEIITFTLRTRTKYLYDLFHIHDISGAISPFTLSFIAKRSPIIWTLHDCSPFTGGCIYPLDCMAYKSPHCHECPQLRNWPLRTSIDHTAYMQAYKINLINKHLRAIVCPSRWVSGLATEAGVDPLLLHVIPNAVDTDIFSPQNREVLRQTLDIPPEAEVVLLATMSFKNPYKGTSFAVKALESIKRQLHVILVGAYTESVKLPDQHHYIHSHRTMDRGLLAKYYAASDVLLFPSMADNCPLTVLESMACGTPVVAFGSGGIPEIVSHDQNGWIAQRGNADDLIKGLELALTDPDRKLSWSKQARNYILSNHGEQAFIESHMALYEKVITNFSTDRA